MIEISSLNLAIAKEFRKRRQALGLSQEKLGNKADVTQEEISLRENAKRMHLTPAFCQICAALGCKVSELIASAEDACNQNYEIKQTN